MNRFRQAAERPLQKRSPEVIHLRDLPKIPDRGVPIDDRADGTLDLGHSWRERLQIPDAAYEDLTPALGIDGLEKRRLRRDARLRCCAHRPPRCTEGQRAKAQARNCTLGRKCARSTGHIMTAARSLFAEPALLHCTRALRRSVPATP
jgi:hypothetical protein